MNRRITFTLLTLWVLSCIVPFGMTYASTIASQQQTIVEGVSDGVVLNETNFPDATFRAYISDLTGVAEGETISDEKLQAVKTINVYSSYSTTGDITSLQGIEFFTELISLNCHNNQLTSLDVSNNTALKSLHCENNRLTSLDVSNNTALTELDCDGNQLTSLDVSNNTELYSLHCSYNKLTSLDVSNNNALITFYCDNNKLTSLDVSNNSVLYHFYCGDNQLTSLNVSNNLSLKALGCENNQLTSLDVSNNTALHTLYCEHNQLTSLIVSNNTELKYLWCFYNQLTSLDVSNKTALEDLQCGNNQLTSLNLLNNMALTTLYCENNQLTRLNLLNNAALTELRCDNNQLMSLNVSGCTSLTTLDCSSDELASLNVSGCTALKSLYCNNNQLTSLNVSNNLSLKALGCENNQLTSLDVSNNTALHTLYCEHNQLTSLIVSNNTELKYLCCFYNQLTSLDVSNNTMLRELKCWSNQLTSLDVSNNTELSVLRCLGNQLMCLTASNCTNLHFSYSSNMVEFSPQSVSLIASSIGSNRYYIPVPSGFDSSKVSGFTVNDVFVTPTVSDGRLFFTSTSTPQTITYHYNTDNSGVGWMDVTISITDVKRQYRVGIEGAMYSITIYDSDNNVIFNACYDSDSFYGLGDLYYDEGSYLKIRNEPYPVFYIKEILVNGVSVGTYEEADNVCEYTIENLSEDMEIQFVRYETAAQRTIKCHVFGRGSVRLYKNDVLVDCDRGTVFDYGDRIKLVFEPENGCVLSSLKGFDYDPDFSLDFTSAVKNNTYTSIAFDGNQYEEFVRNYEVIFDGPAIALTESNFPDASFRSYISSTTGVEEGGYLSDETLKSVLSIDVHSMGITSLQGIEYFSELGRLDCRDNQLTSLDVSKNTKLYGLFCSNNQLTSLDVTKNTTLDQINCSGNQIKSIDVSNILLLYYLDFTDNQMMSLDLSGLNCYYNYSVYVSPQSASLTASSTYPNQYSVIVPTGFDITKVSEFKVDGVAITPTVFNGILSFTSSSIPQVITYQYDSGNSKVGQLDFTINVTSIEGLTYDNTIYMDDMEVLSGTEAILSVKMKNTVVAEGFGFDMYLPDGITVLQDEDGFPEVTLSTERTNSRKTNSFDAVFNADGSLRVLAASTNGSVISGNDGEVVQVKVAIADDMAEGDYTACFKNIAISDENATSHTSAMTTSTIKVNTYIIGDANIDRKVDVADFTAVAHHLLNNTPTNFHQKAADANTDNRIDVGDLTAIAHLILYGTITKPTNTSGAKPFMMMDNGTPTDENYIYIEPVSVQGQSEVTLSVKMRNAVEAEGFEFDLYLPDGMSFVTDADGFAEVSLSTERTNSRKTNSFDSVIQKDGSLRVLAASTNGSSINGNDGEVALVTIHIDPSLAAAEYPLLLKNIAIADVNAVSHSTDLKESTITILGSGIVTDVEKVQSSKFFAQQSGRAERKVQSDEWYTLDGKKLNNKPKAKGVYIMNGQKVVVK